MNDFVALLIAAAAGIAGILAVDLLVMGRHLYPLSVGLSLIALKPLLQLVMGGAVAGIAFRRLARRRAGSPGNTELAS